MSLLPLEEHQEEDPSAYKPIHNLRLRVIPVLGMPCCTTGALACHVCLLSLRAVVHGSRYLFLRRLPSMARVSVAVL
jgi:hypothetical protein